MLQERGVGPKDLEDWPPRLATGKLGKFFKQAWAELESVLTGSQGALNQHEPQASSTAR